MRPPPENAVFIDVPQAKLFAVKAGGRGGIPIVAIGGWIGSSELWIDPLADLSDAHPTVTYDHRGTGLSVCDSASITFETLVNDAIAILDAFEHMGRTSALTNLVLLQDRQS